MAPGDVTLVVPAPLQFFLPPGSRGPEVRLRADGTSTVGHLLASVGVPRTEVGEVLLRGRPVGIGHRPRPGERITVRPPLLPQPTPTSPPRFVLDVHLGTLARRMRLLGLDTGYDRDADDDTLVEISLAEKRVLLTRDRGLLHRRALRWAAHVDHQDPDDQVGEVLQRFAPPLRPWTRCARCNGLLVDVDKSQVEGELPAGTRRSYDVFRRCESCGQVYWEGAHARRLQALVDAVMGRE